MTNPTRPGRLFAKRKPRASYDDAVRDVWLEMSMRWVNKAAMGDVDVDLYERIRRIKP